MEMKKEKECQEQVMDQKPISDSTSFFNKLSNSKILSGMNLDLMELFQAITYLIK